MRFVSAESTHADVQNSNLPGHFCTPLVDKKWLGMERILDNWCLRGFTTGADCRQKRYGSTSESVMIGEIHFTFCFRMKLRLHRDYSIKLMLA